MSRAVTAFVACVALSAPALGATLSDINGQVMVNRGEGYRPVAGTTALNPGDTVVVNPGGSAQITYPDGCARSVGVGSVVTVSAQSPCAAAAQNGTPGVGATAGMFLLNAGVVGVIVGTQLASQSRDTPASP